MSHFAQVINGIVQQVIVAEQDFIDGLSDKENWIQTSYNTRGGVHYAPDTYPPTPDDGVALRMNYAGIGYIYDSKLDAFYTQPPFLSWVLDEKTCLWNPPIPYPTDGNRYTWDENTKSWVLAPAPALSATN